MSERQKSKSAVKYDETEKLSLRKIKVTKRDITLAGHLVVRKTCVGTV